MKKRAKKQQVTATATTIPAKKEEQPSAQSEPDSPSSPEPEEKASESAPEEVSVETEAATPETTEEAPVPPEEEEPKREDAPPEPKPTDDICGPPGKLCTCARSADSLPRIPTAILVERHGERLRKHEDKLDDLHDANEVILGKMLSLKDQVAVSYGLSLVLAIIVCVLALTK